MIFIDALFIFLFAYLAFWTLYLFVFSVAGRLGKIEDHAIKEKNFTDRIRKFAVLIPAYKEDGVIVSTAIDALKMDYPADAYDVIVIADSLKAQTLEKLRNLPIRVVEVSFEKSTKAKALNAAMLEIGDGYEVALILDADNIMEPDFLKKVNNAFSAGYKAVQGHRVAKNTNTSFAILDAVSEEVNNHFFRKGHAVLGFSAALIGSGMAFDYAYCKQLMKQIHAIGGFDKEMEIRIMREKIKIAYVEDAYVYDEKVQKAEVFTNQRRRWISAQFHYFKHYFVSGWIELFRTGNWDYFNKVLQSAQLPRLIYIGVLSLFTLASIILPVGPGIMYWLPVWLMMIMSFVMAIPPAYINRSFYRSLLVLPKAFFATVLLLFKLKDANKQFIHTPHGETAH